MAIVLDEFVINLGLDNQGLRQGVSEAAALQAAMTAAGAKTAEEFLGQMRTAEKAQMGHGEFLKTIAREQADLDKKTAAERDKQSRATVDGNRKIADGFRSIRNEVIGLAAAVVAGKDFTSFITGLVSNNAALGQFATSIGSNVQTIALWEQAATRAGATAQDMGGAIQSASMTLERGHLDAAQGAQNNQVLQGLGIDPAKVGNSWEALFQELARAWDRFKDTDPQRFNFLVGQLGIGGNALNLFRQGSAGMNSTLDETRRHGLPTPEDIRRAQELEATIARLQQTGTNIGNHAIGAIADDLQHLLDALDRWTTSADGQKAIEDFFNEVKTDAPLVWEAIKEGAHDIDAIVKALGGWADVTGVIIGLWTLSKFAPMIGVLRTITGLLGLNAPIAAAAGAVGSAAVAVGAPAAAFLYTMRPSTTNAGEDAELDRLYEQAHPGQTRPRHGPAVSPPAPSATGKTSAAEAISYFTSQGWTRQQAEGIAANFQGESGFDPTQRNPNSTAYGLAQWIKANQDRLAAHFGKPVQQMTAMEQMQALQWDLTEGGEQAAGRALRRTTTAAEAADVYLRRYGRPFDRDADHLSQQRQRFANGYEQSAPVLGPGMDVRLAANDLPAGTEGYTVTNSADNSTTAHVTGPINIYPPNGDPRTIGRGFRDGVQTAFAAQANTGLMP